MTTLSMCGDSSGSSEQHLGDPRRHQPHPRSGTAKESIKVTKGGTEQKREQRYECGLVELVKPECTMGMWSKYSCQCETQLCYVPTGSSAHALADVGDDLRLKSTPYVACLLHKLMHHQIKTKLTENVMQDVKPERKQE
jgi:hypothetical protein